jgi:DNA-binding transcriptional LysR family regulator
VSLDLRQLRYFVAMAENGQLTDAARRLQVAQPTLSQALAQLEEELGVQLFERHTRGVRLTDAGRIFLDKARVAVDSAEEAVQAARAFKRARARGLAVGFHWQPLSGWAMLFQQLCSDHPGTQLDWRPLEFPLAGRSPIEEVDVGLLLEPTPHPDLSVLVLQREPRAVVMAASHPLAAHDELKVVDVLDEAWPGTHPTIDRRWAAFWSLDDQRGAPARTTSDRIINAEEGTQVVASGRAIVTVSQNMVGGFAHPGLVAVPLVDAPPASVALVWRTREPNPLVEALIHLARVRLDGE